VEIAKISYIRQEQLSRRTEYFILDCENQQIEVYHSLLGKPKLIHLEPIESEVALEKILSIMFEWKSYYENSNAIDGFKWRVLVETKEQEKIEYSGQNELPMNFNQMQEIMEEMTAVEDEI